MLIKMRTAITRNIMLLGLLASLFTLAGCNDKFFNPTEVGRFRPTPAVNIILDSLGVAEEELSVWEGSSGPRPIDTMVFETDYRFGPGDQVRISIFELLLEGIPYVNDYVVTETGKVSIPEVGVVEAEGLTESELEEEVKQILSPDILRDPSVSVTLIQSQKRTYAILGNGIPAPSRYQIPRYDFRLTEALATAGGISQFNISYVYVSRSESAGDELKRAVEAGFIEPQDTNDLKMPEDEALELITPMVKHENESLVITSSEMISDQELLEVAIPEGFEPLAQQQDQLTPIEEPNQPEVQNQLEPAIAPGDAKIEWVFKDGKYIPVQVGQKPQQTAQVAPQVQPLPQKPETVLDEWAVEVTERRVIEIPADKLRSGDPRYNVVIRAGDSIHVPVDLIGEFYIMGNTNFQGTINLTGRPMTFKMAVASAGGLGELAWPKKCEIIRRIGKKKEEVVMVDLEKIYNGEQPDFFIKPNDLLNVGTHSTSTWRAVLRNAFRATYGFGFLYDRNFADRDFGTSRPLPNWF